MIKSFRHKGLEAFYVYGTKKGIQPKHAAKLLDLLDRLDAATAVGDLNYPGTALHALRGELQGLWAVRVSGNWRLTFAFHEGNVYVLDYCDYH